MSRMAGKGEMRRMIKEVSKMRIEKRRKRIKDLDELRDCVENELIAAYEDRSTALKMGDDKIFFYSLGKYDAYRLIISLITDEGLLLYRVVEDEEEKKEEDRQGYH